MPTGVAAGFVWLSVAWIAASPSRWPLASLLAPSSTGWLVRRLLPVAAGFVLLLAWMGSRADWAPALLFVFVAFVVFLTLVWRAATALDRLDFSRADLQAYAHEISDLYHHAPCGYHSLDAQGRFVNINDTELGWLGYRREELIGRLGLADLLTPETRATFRRAFADLSRGQAIREVELELRRKDGSMLPVVLSATSLRDTAGKFQRTRASVFDATLRKQAETALRASEERLRMLLNSTGEGIFALDLEGRCTLCNPAALRLLKYSSAMELMGKPMHEVMHHSHADGRPYPAHECKLLRAAERGVGVEVDDEVFWCADGTNIPVEYRCYPVRESAGEEVRPAGMVVTFTDITSRLSLEDKIRHAQKMEAVGRLAAGIAHDFNNLLTIINGYSEMMVDEQPSPAIAEMAGSIRQAGERAAVLTRQLLTFSRQQVMQPRVLDLNARVREIEPLLRRTLGEEIELAVQLAPELPAVQTDPSQLDQILMNLALNARDALPRQGGRIEIATARTHLSGASLRAHPGLGAGDYAVLSVRDNGAGMPPEVRSHIFEPFFTTKPQGQGTGLGLPTVFGIARQSGGTVLVETNPGQGTLMRVLLPAWEKLQAAGGDGNDAILVVEDEPELRRIMTKVLHDRGYRVEAASSAHAALESDTAPSLLLTDLGLPGIGGLELVERMRRQWPELPVLFVSGGAPNAPVPGALLHKPFTPAELTQAVEAALAPTPGGLD
jgi:PAS domain S-box-containing protein